MRNDLFIKTFKAPVAVAGRTIVKLGTNAGEVAASTAVGDYKLGVTTQIGTQDNGMCDVVLAGIVEVVASAAITKGAPVTATTGGQAVTSGAETDRRLGHALEAATQAGDIIAVLIDRN